MTVLRTAGPYDIPGAYAVCHETGSPAPGQNPDLLGHVYAGPYLTGQPELSRVVADESGVAGYLFGCEDSRAFEAWCEAEWWPPLREQYPLASVSDVDAELVQLLHRPPRSPERIVGDFPAHLHIDFLPRARGAGYGRHLIDWLCAELVRRGVPGVHLGVGIDNANAIAFYEHLGFTTAMADDDVRWMTRPLGQAGG
jgi:ribosomal protein S18 acetylase RimI-like enzyme